MTNSLFEIYDPYTFVGGLSLNWGVVWVVLFLGLGDYWVMNSNLFKLIEQAAKALLAEFGNFYIFKQLKTNIVLFLSLFFFFFFINILGLIPYLFACSSHFVFSLSYGFPIWFSFIIYGMFKFTNVFFSHFVPMGTPVVLISFMSLIELVSMLIRPWSLSIRLMANMISGHLLMSLLGDCGLMVLPIQLGLFIFEFFVCFIQAFVFSALLSLYANEV